MQNIKNILKDAWDNKQSYPKTFEALKAAGAQSYNRVDMEKRTVTYFNPDESEFSQEHVPQV